MAKKDIKFTLDTIDSRYSPVGTVKQLDSVFFYIKITENGVTKDLTGQTIKLFAIKEDKKIVEQTTKINITNPREGVIEIELLNAAIQVHGFTYFELEISDSNGIISTSDFILRVNKRVGSDEAIESTNEVAALKKIEEYVAQAKVELQEFKKLQTEMLKTNETINNQEDLRADAELQRVEAENARAIAEEERKSAEQTREENFTQFENKINANTEELKTARTATTGENFNSVDERIDCEIDRINKKIEISFLDQEDKESHTVENTVEGMTTDMIIKGVTLKNLGERFLKETPALNVGEPVNLTPNNIRVTVKVNIEPRDFITVSRVSSGRFYTVFADEINLRLPGGDAWVTENTKVIQAPENAHFVYIVFEKIPAETINSLEESKMLILEGDWTDKPIPKYFKGLKVFGQDSNEINLLSYGENLFNYKTMYSSWWINANGILSKDDSDSKYSLLVPICSLNKLYLNTPYKDRCNIAFLDANDIVLSYHSLSISDVKVVTPKPPLGTRKVLIYLKSNGYDISKDNGIMISYSDVAFKPYEMEMKSISLVNYGLDGLAGVKGVTDQLNSIKNTAIKRFGKYAFTGRENFIAYSSQTEDYFCAYLEKTDIKPNGKAICNNFANKSIWSPASKSEGIELSTTKGTNVIFIKIKSDKLVSNDIEGFKAWLKVNSTTVYYELLEPIETQLTQNINLKIFNEKTYVNFENELSGTNSFKAPVNAAATISRLSRENRALEEENLSLRQDLESTALTLADSDLDLVKQNVDIDFRLMEVEFALDIPQAILSSDKLKNKKGEVKTMARTPYEMMKIVILSGDYDREDYMHKVGKYYERGRMTKEEHDDLMSLMTADEVLSK